MIISTYDEYVKAMLVLVLWDLASALSALSRVSGLRAVS